MEGTAKRARASTEFFIELEGAPRIKTPLNPVCFVQGSRMYFSAGVCEGKEVSIQALSNRNNAEKLEVDSDCRITFFGCPQAIKGPGTVSKVFVKFDATISSTTHDRNNFVVFALGLLRGEEIIAQTECFFLVTHSKRRQSGELFRWLKQNASTLSERFVFGAGKATIFERMQQEIPTQNEKQHSCVEMCIAHMAGSALPKCCSSLLVMEKILLPEAQENQRTDVTGRRDENSNIQQSVAEASLDVLLAPVEFTWFDMNDERFDESFVDCFTGDLHEKSSLEFLSAPQSVTERNVLDPALMLRVQDTWGLAGRDRVRGLPCVHADAVIGVVLLPKSPCEVRVKLFDARRETRMDKRFQLETKRFLIELPKPTLTGLHILDVSVGNGLPETITFTVLG